MSGAVKFFFSLVFGITMFRVLVILVTFPNSEQEAIQKANEAKQLQWEQAQKKYEESRKP